MYHLASVDDLMAADPADYTDDVEHDPWTWLDESAGTIRSRMFASHLGVPREATGAAAVRITDYLSRDLEIVQGRGSMISTEWSQGRVRVAGRVVSDGTKQIDDGPLSPGWAAATSGAPVAPGSRARNPRPT